MIDSMFQEGTDTAIRDQLQRPTTVPRQGPKFRMGDIATAPGQGIGGAASEGIAFGAEILGAFGSVAGAYPEILGPTQLTDQQRQEAEQARRKLLDQGPTYSNEAGDIFRSRAADIMPDPQTTHSSAVVVAGVSKFAAKAVGYSLTAGPAAPLVLGGDEAFTEADKLKQAGVDLPTRAAAGAVAGVVAGGSIVLPVVGATAAKTVGLVAAGGPGGFIAQNAAERAILEHGGYRDLASQYDPFDPVGLALSALVPAAFGAHGYRSRGTPKVLPDLKSEAQAKDAMKLTPEEQARGDAYDLTPENIAELQGEIQRAKTPQDRATLQTELDRLQQRATRETVGEIVRNEPDAEPAARVRQVVDAVDELRLTRDGDAAGSQAHLTALEMAHEQIAAGERVNVDAVLADHAIDPARVEGIRAAREQLADVVLPDRAQEIPQTHETYFHGSVNAEKTTTRSLESQAGRPNAEGQFAGPGTYLSTSRDLAGTYGGEKGRLYEVAQPFERPYDFNAVDPNTRRSGKKVYDDLVKEKGSKAAANKELQRRGFDAITFTSPRGEKIANVFRERPLKDIGEARPKAKGAPQELSLAPVETAPKTAPAGAERTSLDHSVEQISEANPDLMVQLDGMEKPMRVADLLEKVREEAKEDKQEGDFVQAAAACFLRSGG
jgi:hypothetical protein